jgi:ribonuclease P/MRP protein subunit RPP40
LIINIVESLLSDRSQNVLVEGALSESVPVPSGVPQGSVLGPLLFIIFINDLASNISSNIRLFADDCCIYRTIKSNNDQIALQKDLNAIEAWCTKWGMELNLKKCVSMTVSRRLHKIDRNYTIGGVDLDKVDSYKYLGVVLNSKLSFNEQVDGAILRANKALGFVRRNLKSCLKETKLKCYKTLIRPHLEYASSSWDPFLASHVHKLEMVQHRAARFICSKYSRYESVSNMLSELSLSKLQERRAQARVKLFYKINSKLTPLVVPSELVQKCNNGRTGNGKSYVHMPSHSNPYYSSFYPRTVRDWNGLPSDTVCSSSLPSFASKLKNNSSNGMVSCA